MKICNLIEALQIIQQYDKNGEVHSGDNKALFIGLNILNEISREDLHKLNQLGFVDAEGEMKNSLVAFFM